MTAPKPSKAALAMVGRLNKLRSHSREEAAAAIDADPGLRGLVEAAEALKVEASYYIKDDMGIKRDALAVALDDVRAALRDWQEDKPEPEKRRKLHGINFGPGGQ